eukprot:3454372-Alexandrium_andersonii.AAC.1
MGIAQARVRRSEVVRADGSGAGSQPGVSPWSASASTERARARVCALPICAYRHGAGAPGPACCALNGYVLHSRHWSGQPAEGQAREGTHG